MLTEEYKETVLNCNKDLQLLIDLSEIKEVSEMYDIIEKIREKKYNIYRKRSSPKGIWLFTIEDEKGNQIKSGPVPNNAYLAYKCIDSEKTGKTRLRDCCKNLMMIPFGNTLYDED